MVGGMNIYFNSLLHDFSVGWVPWFGEMPPKGFCVKDCDQRGGRTFERQSLEAGSEVIGDIS
jgi:hypothetical protein